MKRSIQVFLGHAARPLGTLHYNLQGKRESAVFEYAADWLAAEDRFAIDPALPLVAGAQFHKATKTGSIFHGAIADTEPDGWGKRVILRDHAKTRERLRRQDKGKDLAPLQALDFLLGVDDQSRIGALRFQDENGAFQRAPRQAGERTTPPLVELADLFAATRAVENQNETEADLAFLRGRGTSLGGLRPKCTIVDAQGCLAIGKFPSVKDERAVTKGEVLALKLAKTAGIAAADAELVHSDGIPVALIRRFDRTLDDERIPYASAATMLGADAEDPAIHSYAELVDFLRSNGADAQTDIEELWRRIAFSIMITNTDDHLHNHGFLHATADLWRLAPAFDVNPFPERVRELKTWISEETGPAATVDALLSAAAYFKIKKPRVKAILSEVENAVASWRDAGRGLGMTKDELDAFADAFEHAERAAARRGR